MDDIETRVIYSRWLAFGLRKLDHHIIKVEPNPYKVEFDCYTFYVDPAFNDDMERLIKEHQAYSKM